MKLSIVLQFEKTLRCNPLFRPGSTILVACSGGPDSTALFHLLLGLSKVMKLKLGVIHFNHLLRGRESIRDERFVRRLAKNYQVPYYAGKGNVSRFRRQNNLSLEEAARTMRYDFFVKTARKYRRAVIALAHTQNDQAETVLMRILQGTGLQGLSGIRPVLKINGIPFVRPLLSFTKKEIIAWLKKNRIPFCLDTSNLSDQFVRNKIRRRLLPWIAREINPRVVPALARIPSIIEDESRAIADMEKDAWKRVFTGFRRTQLSMNRAVFIQLTPSLQFRVINRALKKLDPKSGLSFDAWQILREGLSRNRYRHSLPRDIDLVLTPSEVFFCRK
jgi:tRNA(Ile)-lysidine synthase